MLFRVFKVVALIYKYNILILIINKNDILFILHTRATLEIKTMWRNVETINSYLELN